MSHYDWSKHALILDHSLVKHDMYGVYVRDYILERAVLKQMDRLSLNIVDGFCGGGRYMTSAGVLKPGSPLVILEALRDAERTLNSGRLKPIEIDFRLYCLDADREAIESLREAILASPYAHFLDSRIFLIRGTFAQSSSKLIEQLRKTRGRTIFILDQYGYNAVSFDVLRKIFVELPSPEVILTFAYGFLVSFLTQFDKLCEAFQSIGIPPPAREAYERARSEKDGLAFFVQRELIRAFQSVARFRTPFFITSRGNGAVKGSNLSYWLVHLAQHERANDVMKIAHWDLHTASAHFGGPGLNMLGFDANRPSPRVQPYLFGDLERTKTLHALMDDLPRVMPPSNDWMTVDQLWQGTCNETPSTSAQQREALSALLHHREIEVVGAGGGTKRSDRVEKTDLVRLPSQSTFYFMRRTG